MNTKVNKVAAKMSKSIVIVDMEKFHASFVGAHIKHNTIAREMTHEEIDKILCFRGWLPIVLEMAQLMYAKTHLGVEIEAHHF
jgi:hypothetical protein